MVGWTGLIGKVISFFLEKISGKKLDMLLDDRRKAARLFLRLHGAVSDLEVLCKELIVELRDITEVGDASVSAEWLRTISITIDETSQRFLEATQGLLQVLNIFDPILAQTVSTIEANKFSFLLIAANGFEPQEENGQIRNVKYTTPGAREDELDLASVYKWHANQGPIDYSRPVEWPDNVLMNFVDETDWTQDFLTLTEPESVKRLAALLEKHLESLSKAREGLADLLRQNFKLEDLLTLQTPVTRFDRMHASLRMSNAVHVSYVRWFAGKPVRKIRSQPRSETSGAAEKTEE